MALSLIAASGETRARLRDTKPQVTSLLSSLSKLQKVSSQYVRRKGSSASRVNDVVIPTGHEIFSGIQDYVPFHEWKRKTFYHVNKQNDQRKKEITERINSRKKIAWTKKSVSEYLVCSEEELDLILLNIEEVDIQDCLTFLAILPESASKSNIRRPRLPQNFAKFSLDHPIPLTPRVVDFSFTKIEKETVNHPQGKKSFHISEGLRSMTNWDKIPALLANVSSHAQKMRENDSLPPSNIRPKIVHVPSSDMHPWFSERHYSIDANQMCSLKDIADKPTGHRHKGVTFIKEILARTKCLGYDFSDQNILNQNIYGLRIDPNPSSASITIASPNISFWKNQRVASDKTARELKKGWIAIIPAVDSNFTDILATGFAEKPNSEALRLTVDASGPHTDNVNGLPLAINLRKKLVSTTPASFEWADAKKIFRAIAYIVSLALFSDYCSRNTEYLPIGYVIDLSDYFNHLAICTRDTSNSSRMDIDPETARARLIKALTASFGFSDLPELAQRSSNLTDYAITAFMHEWFVAVATIANRSHVTPFTLAARRILPISIQRYMSKRTEFFSDPRQSVPSVGITFIDDTSGVSYHWVITITHLVRAFIVHKKLETPLNFAKLQVGQLIDLLGLFVDLINLTLGLTAKTIQFWNEYILRFKKAIFIEFTELEKIVGKLYWSLEVRPERKIFVYRMYSFLHNSKAWSKQEGGLIVAKVEPWLRRDLIDCVLLPLLEHPCRPLCLFNELAPIKGSLKNIHDACRNQRTNEKCGMGGFILCGKLAVIWFYGLSATERQVLPIHVTESAANIVACYIIQFFFLIKYFLQSIHEQIDNRAALTAFNLEKSRDVRLVELVQLKKVFQHSYKETTFTSTYIESTRNPADIASHGQLDVCKKILLDIGYEESDITIVTNGHPCLAGTDALLDRLCLLTRYMQDQHKSRYNCYRTQPNNPFP